MAGAFVQSWQKDSATSEVASITVTVSPSPTVNNLLVSTLAVNSGGFLVIGTPTNFTNIQKADSSTTGVCSSVAYKISDGTETSIILPLDTGTQRMAGIVAEYSGLDSSSPLEDSATDTTYIDAKGSVIACGSATPVSANGIGIAFGNARGSAQFGNKTNNPTIDNSYTIDDLETYTSGSYPVAVVASKTYTSTTAQAPSWTCYSSTTWAVGCIAVFKEPGGPAYTRNRLPATLM